jgi:hypothetical protein
MSGVAAPRGPFALRICGGCGEQINDAHHLHANATGAVYYVPALTCDQHEAELAKVRPENGCAWLLWGDYEPDGLTKPLGCYRTRDAALAAQDLAESHPNATSSVCEDYVGFLRPDAPCHSCGAACCEHDLSLELAIRVRDWDTPDERRRLAGVNDRPRRPT